MDTLSLFTLAVGLVLGGYFGSAVGQYQALRNIKRKLPEHGWMLLLGWLEKEGV